MPSFLLGSSSVPLRKYTNFSCLLFSFFLLFIAFFNTLQVDKTFLHVSSFYQWFFTTESNHRINGNDNQCDHSNGKWVWDKTYGSDTYGEDCPFLDPGFQCHKNGRNDANYINWRWQPFSCQLPRFNATDLLERSRNGKIVFAGDSIGRNQWESLVCMLAKVVKNKSRIYEKYHSPITKHKGFLSIMFQDYNLSVEYYRMPFLVPVNRPPANSSSDVHGVIRLDTLHWRSKHWVNADVLIFNSGHWWEKDKTIELGRYFQVGSTINKTIGVREAFRISLKTLEKWTFDNLNLKRSHVFFRNLAPKHYSNGTWNTGGGSCVMNSTPDNSSKLFQPIWSNKLSDEIVGNMMVQSKNVQILNITHLSNFRKDAHPSIHREPGTLVGAPEDCSHWCLPGLPDTWNQILYAHLLYMSYDTRKNHINSS